MIWLFKFSFRFWFFICDRYFSRATSVIGEILPMWYVIVDLNFVDIFDCNQPVCCSFFCSIYVSVKQISVEYIFVNSSWIDSQSIRPCCRSFSMSSLLINLIVVVVVVIVVTVSSSSSCSSSSSEVVMLLLMLLLLLIGFSFCST